MPSPIAHLAIVWPLRSVIRRRHPRALRDAPGLVLNALLVVLVMAPDADLLFGLITREGMFAYHNGPTHSIGAALIVGAAGGTLLARAGRLRWTRGFTLATAACLSHVLLDALTWGRGVLLWWPLSNQRVSSPVPLFIGVRHSENAPLRDHALSLLTEMLFVVVVMIATRKASRRGV